MKLYEIAVRPKSAFGTPLKGDTLFGQFCWQLANRPTFKSGDLDTHLSRYHERPFIVLSSAFPRVTDEKGSVRYALKRPDVPIHWVFPLGEESKSERLRKRKDLKKAVWMLVERDLALDLQSQTFLSGAELAKDFVDSSMHREQAQDKSAGEPDLIKTYLQPHNSIHRVWGTTGSGRFAPYSQEVSYYLPGTELAVFALIDDEALSLDATLEGLDMIGKTGFGRDASIGMGRFTVEDSSELAPPDHPEANALYCMGPCVPEPGSFEKAFFTPFVRFGKHGDRLAYARKPFKNPVIMADEGAVFIPRNRDALTRGHFGNAVRGVSASQENAVSQGYSICLPLRVELNHE